MKKPLATRPLPELFGKLKLEILHNHPRTDCFIGTVVNEDNTAGDPVLPIAVKEQRLRRSDPHPCNVVHA